jgi:hypothetical protein
MSKTVSAILILVGAAVLWYVFKRLVPNDASAALELAEKYLGFATSLAGFFGIAVGGGSLLFTGKESGLTANAMATTATGLSVTLAGGAMVGGDPLAAAAALVAGGLVAAMYVYKKL